MNCPHCFKELTGDWIRSLCILRDDETVDQELECPHCGEDMTENVFTIGSESAYATYHHTAPDIL